MIRYCFFNSSVSEWQSSKKTGECNYIFFLNVQEKKEVKEPEQKRGRENYQTDQKP